MGTWVVFVYTQMPVPTANSRHFRIGIDGQIGLHNVRKSYGFETQTTNKYLHNIVATIGVVF